MRTARWSIRAASSLVTVACTLGCFDTSVPDDAQLLCARDNECVGGMVCNVARHVCVDPSTDRSAPALLEARFEPAALASGAARLVLVADEALGSDAPVPVFAAGSTPLTFTPVGVDGDTWTLLVDVTGALEGVYPLERVTLTDAADNPSEHTLSGVSLRVDRTTPELFDLAELDAPASGVYSDVTGADTSATLSMRVRASEPLDVATTALRLGATRSGANGCALDEAAGSLTYRCTVPVAAAGLVDGANEAHLEAIDAAGNAASAARAVQVDVRAPDIVSGSTTLAISAGGYDTPVAGLNSTVRFGFVASEDLAAPPAASLVAAGTRLPFVVDVAVGRRYELVAFVAAPVSAGAWPIEVSLVDRFGHSATVPSALLPPPFVGGVPFVDGGGAICPAPAPIACVDFDGDGAPQSAACANGGDLDDADALVFPGAFEVPGDGRDNDLVGGDAPLDDSSGIFIDADLGSDAAAGTRAAPIQTLGEARARVEGGAPSALLLAHATASYVIDELAFDVIIGGLDRGTWQRTGERSNISVGGYTDLRDYTEGVRIRGDAALYVLAGTVNRVIVEDTATRVSEPATLIETTLGETELRASASGTRLLRSTVQGSAAVDGLLVADRSTFLDEVDVSGVFGRLLATNSRFDFEAAPIDCFGCARIELHHCTLLARSSGAALFLSSSEATALVTNSVLLSFSDPPLYANGLDELVLEHNLLFGPDVAASVDNVGVSLAELEALPPPVQATSNLFVDPELQLATLLLEPSSPAVNTGGDALAAGAPTTVLADAQGQCRFSDGLPDIGMDELQ